MPNIKCILEAALMVAGRSLAIKDMLALFTEDERPSSQALQEALDAIHKDCENRGYELKILASGYQFQAREEWGSWVARLWQEKPPKLSKALLETLAIIAYRQPVTRAEIEEIRGVATSTTIIKTLLEYTWIKVIAYRDVPGKPALLGTTSQFLDHFNLQALDELPKMEDLINHAESEQSMEEKMTDWSASNIIGSSESLSTDEEVDSNKQLLTADSNPDDASSELLSDAEKITHLEEEISQAELLEEDMAVRA